MQAGLCLTGFYSLLTTISLAFLQVQSALTNDPMYVLILLSSRRMSINLFNCSRDLGESGNVSVNIGAIVFIQ